MFLKLEQTLTHVLSSTPLKHRFPEALSLSWTGKGVLTLKHFWGKDNDAEEGEWRVLRMAFFFFIMSSL